MIDVDKQINYWINGAIDDMDSASILIERGRLLQGLFFCHLSIEKAIKAHVVKKTKEIPPRSHNLTFLSEKADLKISEEDDDFMGILMKYQLQGRYPDYNPFIPKKPYVKDYLDRAKKILSWLKAKL